MYLLSVNLYELGQFLQILLWISLPMVLVVLLVTTYLHYRKKRRDIREESSSDDLIQPSPESWEKGELGDPTTALPEEGGNAYRGLLWMKDKYEQYREQTDRKFDKLKEDLAQSEERYLNLLAVRQPPGEPTEKIVQAGEAILTNGTLPMGETVLTGEIVPTGEKERQIELLQLELEQRIMDYHQLQYEYREEKVRTAELSAQYLQTQEALKTRQFEIEELNIRLLQQQHKLTDLTYKLECNTQLLLRIHQELDSSLHEKENHEVRKIVGWV